MIARRPLLLGAGAYAALAGAARAQAPAEFAGEWNGVLETGAGRLRLRLVITDAVAELYSLDQGNVRIPGAVAIADGVLTATFAAVRGQFVGRIANGQLSGTWTQGGTLPLSFARGDAPTPANDPIPLEPLTQQGLANLRAASGAPAMAAIAVGPRRRVAFVDGRRAADAPTPATIRDRWHLGSITKSMTATLVARAVEIGAVSWDDTLGGVLGPAVPDMRDEYKSVSFRHLLSHRSGLPANIPVEQLVAFPRENPDPRADRVRYAQIACAQAPAGPKEATFLYSNSGFILAGAMLEAKMGAQWEALIRTHVFTPLGMTSAGFGAPGTPGRLDEPVGHGLDDQTGVLTPVRPGSPATDNPAVLGPAGRVHARLDDVIAYATAHRDNGPLLRRESWTMLHTPPFGGDYALGWVVLPDGGFWHDGSNTIWYARVAFNPRDGVVAAAAANSGVLATVRPNLAAALRNAIAAVS